MSVTHSVLNEIRTHINKGRYKKARQLAESLLTSYSANNDVDFWLLYGIAVISTDHNKNILSTITTSMEKCSNFNLRVHGDWLREKALDAINQNNLDEAEIIIEEVYSIHNYYADRLAAITMVKARIAYRRHNFSKALELHLQAESICRNPDTVNKQWQADNIFYMLKAIVASHKSHDERYLTALRIIGGNYMNDNDLFINNIINYKGDENYTRRWRAWLINMGYVGNLIDDFLTQHIHAILP